MKLKIYMETNGITLETAATELGMSYENVRRYAAGLVIPRIENMKKIVEWSGGLVNANDFYLAEEGQKRNEKSGAGA